MTNTHAWAFDEGEKGVGLDRVGGEESFGVVEGGFWPELRVVVGALDVDHDGGALEVRCRRREGVSGC